MYCRGRRFLPRGRSEYFFPITNRAKLDYEFAPQTRAGTKEFPFITNRAKLDYEFAPQTRAGTKEFPFITNRAKLDYEFAPQKTRAGVKATEQKKG